MRRTRKMCVAMMGVWLMAIVGLLFTANISQSVFAAEPAAPVKGADSAAKLLARFADAVDNGDAAAAQACLDISTDGARKFSAYIVKLAEFNAARLKLLNQIEKKYGKDVRAEAVPLLDPSFFGGMAGSYAGLKNQTGDELKEGAEVYTPGVKGPAKLVKKNGVWLLDPTEILEGIDQKWIDDANAHYDRMLKAGQQAADAAGSAKELIEKLKDEARK